jgi:hypothetical protein
VTEVKPAVDVAAANGLVKPAAPLQLQTSTELPSDFRFGEVLATP